MIRSDTDTDGGASVRTIHCTGICGICWIRVPGLPFVLMILFGEKLLDRDV